MMNPLNMVGIGFLEFTGPDPKAFEQTFAALGFSKHQIHRENALTRFSQNHIDFILNQQSGGFEADFGKQHGQSVCAVAFRFKDPEWAYAAALERGAKAFDPAASHGAKAHELPAVYGVGGSLIYFMPASDETYYRQDFKAFEDPENAHHVSDKRFLFVDHLTNNVLKGTMGEWSDFYKNIFGFTEIQYFDIKGSKTGLTSFALKSPCQTFSIPINEGNEEKSQIEEYLREYNGAGVQHIALATEDLLDTLDRLQGSGIQTLDIDDDYYEEAFQRVPNVTEDRRRVQNHQVLIDGDEDGYLLQIFTRNLFGPIFFEMIQRKNHHAFGEGNFGALFKSIERDQERRGVL